MEGLVPSVGAVLVMDSEGNRIVARYFQEVVNFSKLREDPTAPADQLAFEKKLFEKTARTNAKNEVEILYTDGVVSVYRNSCDVWLYLVGSQAENELILHNCLEALHESLISALRGSLDRRLLLENFDTLLLTIDELVDATTGMVLETDPDIIAARVVPSSAGRAGSPKEAKEGVNMMLSAARNQLARTLLK